MWYEIKLATALDPIDIKPSYCATAAENSEAFGRRLWGEFEPRGMDGNLGPQHGDTFRNDFPKDLKADFVVANPPFNNSDWGGEHRRKDVRWKYGIPPVVNANFAWVQHFIHRLFPNGMTGFLLANISMSSNQSGEGEIRRKTIEADPANCVVTLPGQLF